MPTTHQRRYQRLVAAGLCIGCRQAWIGPPVRCETCSARTNARTQAKRAALHEQRKALGLEPRTRGWNGFRRGEDTIGKLTPDEARALAAREARRVLLELRKAQRDDKLSIAALDVLHALYDRGYKAGRLEGRARRKGEPADARAEDDAAEVA